MDFAKACRDIKSLKIQGATNVAVSALAALSSVALKSKAKDAGQLLNELSSAKEKLFATRPTEPMMRNFANFFTLSLEDSGKDVQVMKTSAKKISGMILGMKQLAKEKILDIGQGIVPENAVVFTHCHSSTVTGILINAARRRKFEVYNTETRPRFQGRLTAAELAKHKIPVTHFVDSAVRLALKKADVMLIGADAITPTGIFNKIGSNLFAEVAAKYDVPVYVCTTSWKFDPETIFGHEEIVEMRDGKEVWDKAPKGVKVMNYAFEKVNPELVTGIISELGIYKPDTFVQEMKKANPWMFSGL